MTAQYILDMPRTELVIMSDGACLSWQPIPNQVAEGLVRKNPVLEAGWIRLSKTGSVALVGHRRAIDVDNRCMSQHQIRHHASKDDAAPIVQMSRIISIQIVHLRRCVADHVNVGQTGLVEIEDPRRGRVASRNGGEALVVERIRGIVVRGKDPAGQGGDKELGAMHWLVRAAS
jgi:hypothetical protein